VREENMQKITTVACALTLALLSMATVVHAIIVPPRELYPPNANFLWGPLTPHPGQLVTFDGSLSHDPDGTIISYAWDFGDGGTGTGVGPTHTYARGGGYTVTLTVTDNDGLTDSRSKTVGVMAGTIRSCDSGGVAKDTFQQGDAVYANGGDYLPDSWYTVYVVADTTWVDGMAIPARIPGTATSVFSDEEGGVPAQLLWNHPLAPGKYDIVVDVNGNGKYDADVDALADNHVQVTAGFFVIPEVYLGTILGLAAFFMAFGTYFMHKRRLLLRQF
jgi:PKD repeat protein